VTARPSVAELLPLLQPGQVLLVRRRGPIGALIRRVTGGDYNHVALVDVTAQGILITVEASDLDGVQAKRFEAYLEDESVEGLLLRDRPALTPLERAAIMRTAWLRVGARYDTLQLVGIYTRHRLPWMFGGPVHALDQNRLDDRDRLICSELVSLAYFHGAGMFLAPPSVSMGMVDPAHIQRSGALTDVWSWRAPEAPPASVDVPAFAFPAPAEAP
jgi:hypothetical protein